MTPEERAYFRARHAALLRAKGPGVCRDGACRRAARAGRVRCAYHLRLQRAAKAAMVRKFRTREG